MNNRTKASDVEAWQPSHGSHGTIRRRSFLKALGTAGIALGAGLGIASMASAAEISVDDVAILRFLAAAELVESDLWLQYAELVAGNPAYQAALMNLDSDMPQYVLDNTDDEKSHAAFLNGLLTSIGAPPVNFDAFRTLPSSPATGAAQMGRLTNLTALTVDTSWYLLYRSAGNPDFGDTFPQLIDIVNRTAIPLRDDYSGDEIQAIANTAGFHFASIEQGGSSLYASLIPQATHRDVIRTLVGIGGSEVNHFAVWHDKAGNAPAVTVDGLVFPDLGQFDGDASRQINLIMPEPCEFLRPDLPVCSVIRPASLRLGGAFETVRGWANSGLFAGQSAAFFQTLSNLAAAADQAGA